MSSVLFRSVSHYSPISLYHIVPAISFFNILIYVICSLSSVSITSKLGIFRACVHYILLCGSETWATTAFHERKTHCFCMKWLLTDIDVTQVDSKIPTMGAARPRKKFRSNSFRSVKFRTPRNDEHRALSISDALDARRSTTRLLFEYAQLIESLFILRNRMHPMFSFDSSIYSRWLDWEPSQSCGFAIGTFPNFEISITRYCLTRVSDSQECSCSV